jgi:glucokinase
MIILGVDIGGTTTKVVLRNRRGGTLQRAEIATRAEEGADSFAGRLSDLVADWPEPVATGLSVAGLIDAEGRIVQAPNLEAFVGVDLMRVLERFGVSVLENDVNCAIYGEWQEGAGRGARHLAMLSLGTGVGGGLILGGKLYRGSGGLGAELGHMLLDPAGPECPCGLRGHVESWLGARGFAALARARAREYPESALAAAIAAGAEPEARLIAHVATEGCPVGVEVLQECGRWLGIACANLVAILQPDRIIVGGGSARCGDLLLNPALGEYDRRCMDASRSTVPIVVAELGVESAAIGAALLARANLDADHTNQPIAFSSASKRSTPDAAGPITTWPHLARARSAADGAGQCRRIGGSGMGPGRASRASSAKQRSRGVSCSRGRRAGHRTHGQCSSGQ